MKDLKDQLNKGQRAAADAGSSKGSGYYNKPVIIAVIAICAILLIGMIVAIILGLRFTNKAVEVFDDPANTTYSYNLTGGSYTSLFETTTIPGEVSTTETVKEFSYGVVAGNNYQSDFSGLKFYGSQGWVLQDHNSVSSPGNGTIYDMYGTSEDGETSVIVMYYPLNQKYSTVTSMLKAMESSTSGTVLNDTISVRKARHNFTGYMYSTESNGTTTYSEVIGTEVNGYALIIQAKAWTTNQLSAAMAYFK